MQQDRLAGGLRRSECLRAVGFGRHGRGEGAKSERCAEREGADEKTPIEHGSPFLRMRFSLLANGRRGGGHVSHIRNHEFVGSVAE